MSRGFANLDCRTFTIVLRFYTVHPEKDVNSLARQVTRPDGSHRQRQYLLWRASACAEVDATRTGDTYAFLPCVMSTSGGCMKSFCAFSLFIARALSQAPIVVEVRRLRAVAHILDAAHELAAPREHLE
jgi:hypothetical protein